MKTYKYVGPPELLALIDNDSRRIHIQADVVQWLQNTNQQVDADSEVIVTFVIDIQGDLWIADRHSEHVVCAKGGPVLSAGEMTFHIDANKVEVSAVTNQSTGFCPEPDSWASVAEALDKIGIAHEDGFTTKFDFRRCEQCHSINLVKDQWFVCSICDTNLSGTWNLE